MRYNKNMNNIEERYRVFTGLILSLSRSIQRIKNQEMANFGLKGNQVQCIFTLYHANRGMNLSELAELCDEDKGAMSRTVKQLVEQGLVKPEGDDPKRYKTPYRLTKRGREFAAYVTNRIASISRLGGTGVTGRERKEMYPTLTQIAENLERFCKQNYEKEATEAAPAAAPEMPETLPSSAPEMPETPEQVSRA